MRCLQKCVVFLINNLPHLTELAWPVENDRGLWMYNGNSIRR